MQDNGTAVYNDGYWEGVYGADGMECVVDYENSDTWYISSQSAIKRKRKNDSFPRTLISSNWFTPYKLDVNNTNKMYVGRLEFWKSSNIQEEHVGDIVWEQITSFNNYPTINDIEQSLANPNICYFSRGKNLYRSDNFTSDNITFSLILESDAFINDIALHPQYENYVYYSTHSSTTNVIFKSTNKGQTFNSITGGLPNVSINSIVVNEDSNEEIYIGTDIGVFFKNTTMDDWAPFMNGLPNVIVSELEIFNDGRHSKLKAATYGRGLWQSDLDCQNVEDIDLTITGSLSTSFRHASNNITSDATISANKNVIFRAGNSIHLTPGFHVEKGAKFHAYIAGCEEKENSSNRFNVLSNIYKDTSKKLETNIINNEKKIEIYPNPCNNFFIVKGGTTNIKQLEIYNISGMKIRTINNISFNSKIGISNLQQGVYIVKVIKNNESFYHKIVKNK